MSRLKMWYPVIRDVAVTLTVVASLLGGLFIFSGIWPPMVVIESGSMQHSSDESSVGVIDAGDLTVVRAREKVDHIITWVEGREKGHESYGASGDVIVFRKNGLNDTTPVIHRAIVWIDFNLTTGNSFDVPSMALYDVEELVLEDLPTFHNGSRELVDLWVDLRLVLGNFDGVKAPHGGYLTKGDNNPHVDQISLYMDVVDGGPSPVTRRVEPIRGEWIVGVSRGELPWFGVIKLMFSEDAGDVPGNSVTNLLITIGLIVVLPTLLDLAYVSLRSARGRSESGDGERSGEHEGDEEDGDERENGEDGEKVEEEGSIGPGSEVTLTEPLPPYEAPGSATPDDLPPPTP